jgi:hypothetical protein
MANNTQHDQHNGSDGTLLIVVLICVTFVTVIVAVVRAAAVQITVAVKFIFGYFIVIQSCMMCNFI